MSDNLDRFHAMASEHEVLPAWFIGGEGREATSVLVRCFEDEGGAIRLVIEHEQGAGSQLVINAGGLQRIVAAPQRR
jgi:hypothetical protein